MATYDPLWQRYVTSTSTSTSVNPFAITPMLHYYNQTTYAPVDVSFDPFPKPQARPQTAREWLDAEVEKVCALARA